MDRLFSILVSIPAILLAFTCHEFAHAKVADMLGDKTPRFQGRLTFNPIKHLDPLGTLLILIVGFGWAKPVQTNPSAYKNYYMDDLKVSLAGPLTNLVLAFIGYICYKVVIILQVQSGIVPGTIIIVLINMIYAVFTINTMLFVFNLLPLPGLDGFAVLRDLKPKFFYKISDSIYKYQMIIIILIIVGGSKIIRIPINYLQDGIATLGNGILSIFF
ncbi:site-2 protease family protein [Clostridium vincentii]|uniref:Peptidase family M50 n=1 Tax=Clostridium vincentii TaxID=52704 RepID=A0A2T0BBT9_9CLOT|nr:site-2 protease family protein [Clostridium vincentii]PRR81305.1 Peptidase family M50 [Clostridium vincentii]